MDINNLHHAYLVIGNESDTRHFVSTLFNNLGIQPTGNPDVFIWGEDKFGIDESRLLKERSESKAFGEKKFFIITSTQITIEAQNALLKVFEEPTPNTHFLILAQRNNLIPTLLSRLNVVNLFSRVEQSKQVEEFLGGNASKRLALFKIYLADETFNLPDFLDELIMAIKNKKGVIRDIKDVYELSLYANDPAVNSRMIIEHLALTLPDSIE
jgi:hypothetical protein